MNKTLKKHFTASAIIIAEGKVLLVWHRKFKVWLYPGGHLEENESPDEAVVREVREETGLSVEIIGETDKDIPDPSADVSVLHNPYIVLCEKSGDHYNVDMVYQCRIIGSCISGKRCDWDLGAIGFFTLAETERMNLLPNFRRLLRKAFGQPPEMS